MMNEIEIPSTLLKVEIPVPPRPLFEHGIGYRIKEPARYLAMWWEPAGDELWVTDGRVGFDGDWAGYLQYIKYPQVSRHLHPFNLGSSEDQADHGLLVDLDGLQAWVGPIAKVNSLLGKQWNSTPTLKEFYEITPEMIQQITSQFQEWTTQGDLTSDVLQQSINDQLALLAWMDALPITSNDLSYRRNNPWAK